MNIVTDSVVILDDRKERTHLFVEMSRSIGHGLKMVSVSIKISPVDDVILNSTSCFRGRLSII